MRENPGAGDWGLLDIDMDMDMDIDRYMDMDMDMNMKMDMDMERPAHSPVRRPKLPPMELS